MCPDQPISAEVTSLAECIGCGGFIDPARCLVSRRGNALRYCTQECHDDYEAELDRREQHQRDRKAFRDWEDSLYADYPATSKTPCEKCGEAGALCCPDEHHVLCQRHYDEACAGTDPTDCPFSRDSMRWSPADV